MSKPIIYCDMDGVLADFKTGAQRTTGMSINKWMNIPSSREKWALIKAKKDFWSTLPWMPGGRQLWSYISKFDPHILSAYVEESYDPNCIPGKTQWLRKNAGMSSRSKINLVRRKEKKLFAKKGNPSILIDDYEKNVREFIIAGGKAALLQPVENAEDDETAAKRAVSDQRLGPDDCLIGLAASGKTPFTIAALRAARAAGCLTVGISNNSGAPLLDVADYPVCLATGAEALAGSTRLKAGTAQKICLNLISTQLMVLMGKVRHGLMAEMKPRNAKLEARHAEIQAMLAAEQKS